LSQTVPVGQKSSYNPQFKLILHKCLMEHTATVRFYHAKVILVEKLRLNISYMC